MTLIRVKDLRGFREQRGLSLKEAAEKLKTSENTLSSIERETYTTSTRHEIVRNYIRFLLCIPDEIILGKTVPQKRTFKQLKRQRKVANQIDDRGKTMKNKSHIPQVSVKKGRELGELRTKLGIPKSYAAQLLGLSRASILNKERGSYLFTREEYNTLKAVYEAKEKYQGGLNNE